MKRNEITQGINEADKHSFVGKIQRGHELKKKVDQTWVDTGAAQKRGDHPEASKSFRKHERYANLERPGTWTKVKDEGIGDTVRRAVKSVKRGMQGWGGAQDKPSEIVKRNKSYSDDMTKRISGEEEFDNRYMKSVGPDHKPNPHSPRGLQQRVLDREIKKRGIAQEGGEIGYDALSPENASEILQQYDRGVSMSDLMDHYPELSRMMDNIAGDYRLHGDDDFEEIEAILQDQLADIAGESSYEGVGEDAMQQLTVAKDDDKSTELLDKATGVKQTIDKTNPNAPRLAQDPQGKLMLTKPGGQATGTEKPPSNLGKTVAVTPEAVNRVAAGGHTHGDELNTTGTESPISGDEAADNYNERLRKLAGL